MKTKKQLLIFLISSLFGGNLIAQQSINSSGGMATGAGGTVSYSVGQIDYTAQTGTNGNVNQGVQQPLEFFNLSVTENHLDFSVLLYPNPVASELHVDLSGVSLDQLRFTLTDATGKLIQSEIIQDEQITINMVELSRANYFLNFTIKGKIVSTYQIIKN